VGGFFEGVFEVFSTGGLYGETVRFALFLAFCAAGEWVAERAGTINISTEGMALLGAFYAAVISDQTGSLWLGLAAGIGAGMLVGAIQGNLSHRLTANQFGVGLTLNLLVLGFTSYLLTRQSLSGSRAKPIPGLDDLPGVFGEVLGQRLIGFLIVPVVVLAWWMVFRTRWGLEVRAVGENPQAADVSRIDVNKRRREAILFCGATCGLAGAFLSLETSGFTRNMTAGNGIIAIAAVIFGGWTLRGTIAGCLLFGLAQALSFVVQAKGYDVNLNLLGAVPYIAPLVVMAFFAKRTRAPRSLARPFVRGLN
jgi:simple sugar transport system permease protein